MTRWLSDEQIHKAVNWWSDVIQHPKMDNGDRSFEGMFGLVASEMLAKRYQPTQIQVELFKTELSSLLSKIEVRSSLLFASIGVDYHPDPLLAEAADKCQINYNVFPIKTQMHFENGSVKVRYGYGAPFEEI